MILVYALTAFVAGAGILLDARDELTFVGELLLGVGAALLIAWLAVSTGRAWIWLAGSIIFAAAWTLRDLSSDGVSGRDLGRVATMLGFFIAAVVA